MVDIDKAHYMHEIKLLKRKLKKAEELLDKGDVPFGLDNIMFSLNKSHIENWKKENVRTLAVVDGDGSDSFIEYTDAEIVIAEGKEYIKLTHKLDEQTCYYVATKKDD